MAPTATFNDSNAAATTSASKPANPSLDIVLYYPDLVGPSSTSTTRHHFITSLRTAMVHLGFFYLSSSPLESHRSTLFSLARHFFDSSIDQREKIAQVNSRHFRGYGGLGMERTQKKEDNREQIDLGIEAPALPFEVTKLKPYLNLWGKNQLPEEDVIPGLRGIVLQYIEAAEEVAIQLTGAIEEALGVETGTLQQSLGLDKKQEAFAKVEQLVERLERGEDLDEATILRSLPDQMPYERMKLVRYGQSGNSQGVGAHRDGGWITLLATDSKPGLQVEDLDGTWLDVPPRPNTIVVNFGQQLERASNGIILAATHRVKIDEAAEDRISTPYFAMPSLTTVIQPISQDGMSREVLDVWEEARKIAPERKSSVPEGDLHGKAEEVFGEMAWRGIIRSHPDTYQRWYGNS